MKSCKNCGKENHETFMTPLSERGASWWHLSGYFGIFGYFCPDCFRKVAHDSSRNPENPKEYKLIAVKQQLQRANNRS